MGIEERRHQREAATAFERLVPHLRLERAGRGDRGHATPGDPHVHALRQAGPRIDRADVPQQDRGRLAGGPHERLDPAHASCPSPTRARGTGAPPSGAAWIAAPGSLAPASSSYRTAMRTTTPA